MLSEMYRFCVSGKRQRVEQFIFNSDLERSMQELIGSYIMMEEYFMRQMVVKVTLSSCYHMSSELKLHEIISVTCTCTWLVGSDD